MGNVPLAQASRRPQAHGWHNPPGAREVQRRTARGGGAVPSPVLVGPGRGRQHVPRGAQRGRGRDGHVRRGGGIRPSSPCRPDVRRRRHGASASGIRPRPAIRFRPRDGQCGVLQCPTVQCHQHGRGHPSATGALAASWRRRSPGSGVLSPGTGHPAPRGAAHPSPRLAGVRLLRAGSSGIVATARVVPSADAPERKVPSRLSPEVLRPTSAPLLPQSIRSSAPLVGRAYGPVRAVRLRGLLPAGRWSGGSLPRPERREQRDGVSSVVLAPPPPPPPRRTPRRTSLPRRRGRHGAQVSPIPKGGKVRPLRADRAPQEVLVAQLSRARGIPHSQPDRLPPALGAELHGRAEALQQPPHGGTA
mmetsp:Transcript_32648/g.79062  ORF Transcript_32648/g.79062 Transcript_32648/m.79062 type:complete len:361 (-) Transcript_32648:404-1486(-)